MTDIKMPQLGESIAEGTIALWLVEVGGRVELDQPLVQVTTDKADVDIPSSVAGVLTEIIAEAGTTVKVGAVIARIDDTVAPAKKEEIAASQKTLLAMTGLDAKKDGPAEHPLSKEGLPAAEAMKEVGTAEEVIPPTEISRGAILEPAVPSSDRSGFYSPAVMRLAMEHGVDLKAIKGTGEGGRVTKGDVIRATIPPSPLEAPELLPSPPQPAPPLEASPVTSDVGFGVYRPPVYEVEEGDTETPFSRLRRLIADHMVYSKRTSAHVTTFSEVDLDHIVGLRDKIKAGIKANVGINLTFLPFVMLAAIRALKDYPLMNSVVQAESILTRRHINMGVAVDSERGLMVPVIRQAGEMGLLDIAKAVNDLSIKVRDRKISPDELAGGTFTVTNPGRKGNLFGTPIISQPQVGILRMGEVVKRPVVVEVDGEDAIVIRPMMFLSLSYDHRVVDGLTANEFLHRIKEYLEEGAFTI